MNTVTLEIEVRNSSQSYTSPAITQKTIVAPFEPSFKRSEDAVYPAAQRLVFSAPVLHKLLAENVLTLLGTVSDELSPAPVEPVAAPEGDEVEDNEVAGVDVERVIIFRLKEGNNTLAEFGSGLKLKTTANMSRDRMSELLDIATKPLIARAVELLVLNDVIPVMPSKPRTSLPLDVLEAVNAAEQARVQAWQMSQKLDALRRAREATARVETLKAAIRAELAGETAPDPDAVDTEKAAQEDGALMP
jgi:hypothetical protein